MEWVEPAEPVEMIPVTIASIEADPEVRVVSHVDPLVEEVALKDNSVEETVELDSDLWEKVLNVPAEDGEVEEEMQSEIESKEEEAKEYLPEAWLVDDEIELEIVFWDPVIEQEREPEYDVPEETKTEEESLNVALDHEPEGVLLKLMTEEGIPELDCIQDGGSLSQQKKMKKWLKWKEKHCMKC